MDVATVLRVLADRGLRRVLTEGGPSLHSTFIDAGLLDELCLTLAPMLVGGQARRISTGAGQVQTGMRRAHLLADETGKPVSHPQVPQFFKELKRGHYVSRDRSLH